MRETAGDAGCRVSPVNFVSIRHVRPKRRFAVPVRNGVANAGMCRRTTVIAVRVIMPVGLASPVWTENAWAHVRRGTADVAAIVWICVVTGNIVATVKRRVQGTWCVLREFASVRPDAATATATRRMDVKPRPRPVPRPKHVNREVLRVVRCAVR